MSIDGNVFQYVQLDKLLQGETGYTQNEPKQIAVQGAIEKAVKSLIMEGVQLHLWSFKDSVAGAALVAQYDTEKYGDTFIPNAAYPALPVTRNAAGAVQTTPLPVSMRPTAAPLASVQSYPAPPGLAIVRGRRGSCNQAVAPTPGR